MLQISQAGPSKPAQRLEAENALGFGQACPKKTFTENGGANEHLEKYRDWFLGCTGTARRLWGDSEPRQKVSDELM